MTESKQTAAETASAPAPGVVESQTAAQRAQLLAMAVDAGAISHGDMIAINEHNNYAEANADAATNQEV